MTKTPRAIVFAPYLATMGGGERVVVAAAETLSRHFAVEVFSPQMPDPERWVHLGFPATEVTRVDARQFMRRSTGVELAVVMSNHVPLPSFARRSLLIVQFPGAASDPLPRWQRWRNTAVLSRYSIITYSEFNRQHIHRRWGVDSDVVPPPVRQYRFDPDRKTRTILSVGRLGAAEGHKRHDVLLDAWSDVGRQLDGWELVIAGVGRGEDPAVRRLCERAMQVGGVRVVRDASLDELSDLYERASIYWHAAGYGRPVDRPDLAEHFGMSTVEAMSAGAIPVVYGDGGQVEIIEGTPGRLWRTVDELVSTTVSLVTDPSFAVAAPAVVRRAASYSRAAFEANITALVAR
jgi:glycosyltransferase involved in cell wall biosynthesis